MKSQKSAWLTSELAVSVGKPAGESNPTENREVAEICRYILPY